MNEIVTVSLTGSQMQAALTIARDIADSGDTYGITPLFNYGKYIHNKAECVPQEVEFDAVSMLYTLRWRDVRNAVIGMKHDQITAFELIVARAVYTFIAAK